ncbi:MAG: hypothetical protein HYZ42_07765, partial [Bacteroidetes bacterium]|nr:hypothetical protein [Bacteroidota bacterium]
LDSFFIDLKGSTLEGTGRATYTGCTKVNLTHRVDGLKEEEKKKYIESLCGLGSNKYNLISYEIKGLQNRDTPFVVLTKYDVPDYTQTNGNEVYINLNVDKSYSNASIDTAQTKCPIENDYKSRYICNTFFKVPSNMSIDYIPDDVSYKNDLFSFEIKYIKKENMIIQMKTVTTNYLMLYPKDFDVINKGIKKLNMLLDD